MKWIIGLLTLIGTMAQVSDETPLVYTMQENATFDEIRCCIGAMDYHGIGDLSRRLVVEASGDMTIDAFWRIQHAIGRLGAFSFMLREKDGERNVEFSLCTGEFPPGTIIYAELTNSSIFMDGQEMSSAEFQHFVQSGLEQKGLPLRLYFCYNGNTIHDLLDALELIDVNLLKAKASSNFRLIMILKEEMGTLG